MSAEPHVTLHIDISEYRGALDKARESKDEADD